MESVESYTERDMKGVESSIGLDAITARRPGESGSGFERRNEHWIVPTYDPMLPHIGLEEQHEGFSFTGNSRAKSDLLGEVTRSRSSGILFGIDNWSRLGVDIDDPMYAGVLEAAGDTSASKRKRTETGEEEKSGGWKMPKIEVGLDCQRLCVRFG
jgi:hypothetical protein